MQQRYRRTGVSEVDIVNDPGDAAVVAARTQPVGGVGAFQQGPAPGSAAARALLNASIENRGTVGSRTGIYREGYRGPPVAVFDRGIASGIMNAPLVRGRLASNNLTFVRQLGWVSDVQRLSCATDLYTQGMPSGQINCLLSEHGSLRVLLGRGPIYMLTM